MDETETVTEFVHDFLDRSIQQEALIRWKSVIVGMEPHYRHHSTRSSQLSLTENECQDRYEQVHFRDPDDVPGARRTVSEHLREQQRRVVLLALWSVESLKVYSQRIHADEAVRGRSHPPPEVLRPGGPEIVQERQENLVRHPDLIPYFLILLYSVPRSIPSTRAAWETFPDSSRRTQEM